MGVGGGLVGVHVGLTLVGVGVSVTVDVGVGVSVGAGVRVGVGVALGTVVAVGVLVGVGVREAVGVAVRVGTSTRTGTSLATACTVLTATKGWMPWNLSMSQGPTVSTKATPAMMATPSNKGLTQSCRRGSPQAGHTSRLRLLTFPQWRQRTCRGCR